MTRTLTGSIGGWSRTKRSGSGGTRRCGAISFLQFEKAIEFMVHTTELSDAVLVLLDQFPVLCLPELELLDVGTLFLGGFVDQLEDLRTESIGINEGA
jgi:hypothetical protein